MRSTLDETRARWRRLPARARRLALLAAGLLAAWGVALALANRPATRERLRAAAREALARRLPGAELGEHVSVGPLFHVTLGPLTLRAERKGAPPLLRADRVRVRVRWGSLLTGHPEPASVRLYGVRIEPGDRFAELRAAAERLRAPPEARRPGASDARAGGHAWPELHLRDAVVALRRSGRTTEIGPYDVDLERSRDGQRERLEGAVSHRSGARLQLSLARDPEGWRLAAGLSGLGPAALPAPLRAGAVRWIDGTAQGELVLEGRTGSPATGRLRARLARAAWEGARLAPAPVGPVTVELSAGAGVDLAARRAAIAGGALRLLDAVDGTLDADLTAAAGLPFSVALDLPAVDYPALVAALPPLLQPPFEAPRPQGTFAFRIALGGALLDPASWSVDARLDLAPLREAAERAAPAAIRAPFRYRPDPELASPAAGGAPELIVGPENPDFVPLAELPEHVVRAVTTSEDAGFFGHSGFDFEELRNALAQGTQAGRVVRGASTISQQLAKNLYLSPERTFARKAREALVTIALEASVPKRRLIEIYLNAAEWGPGLFGIGAAARDCFGKDPRALSPREAAFLASLVPSPVRLHAWCERGALDEAWTERVATILRHMGTAGVLDEGRLAEALAAPLEFHHFAGGTPSGVPPAAEPETEPAPEGANEPGAEAAPGERSAAPSGGGDEGRANGTAAPPERTTNPIPGAPEGGAKD
jgi:penicillin-binding protein 1A